MADFIDIPGVYAAGRLDFDSEGLVVLTDDGALQARIAQPHNKMHKHYLCQVSGIPGQRHIERLSKGVVLNDGPARALAASLVISPKVLLRDPPVKHPHATGWLEVVIDEGRNRQVRRMLAAVELPVLRLIRTRIGPWHLADLAIGAYQMEQLHVPKPSAAPLGKRSSKPFGKSFGAPFGKPVGGPHQPSSRAPKRH